MFDEFEISRLQRKIEQIEREINVLRNSIEEEEIYIGEVNRSKDKLDNARGNLLDVSEKIFAQIGFLKSAEYLKAEMRSSITGSSYEAAMGRINRTQKNLEEEKSQHQKDIEKLKQMKKNYEQQLRDLRNKMMEEN